MKVALVYDRINKFGGAERVLMALHEIWPEAPVFTSVYDREGAPWADGWDIRTSWLMNIPGAKTNHESLGWLMPLVFESLDLSKFDVVISLTSEAAKGVITRPGQLHVCYLLTPTRYLWSHASEYLDQLPGVVRLLAVAVQSRLRVWDYLAGQRPDFIISISDLVRKRCEKYYRRQSEVIYPPMQLNIKRSDLRVHEGRTLSERKHYLIASRLVPYKRIDLAIEVCNQLKLPLVIVGTGSDEKRLKRLAGQTVQFVGHLTDSELVGYYRGTKALLMPQEEDFGLVGVEAQAYGVPVITYAQSGAAEYVRDGENGVLFKTQSVTSIIEAVHKLEVYPVKQNLALRDETSNDTARFSLDKFKQEFRSTIEKLWKARQ